MSRTADPRLQLAPPGSGARTWLLAICFLLPVAITGAAIVIPAVSGTAPDLLAGSLPLTIAALFAGSTVLCAIVGWILARSMRRQQLTVSGDALEVRSSFYRCRMPLAELRLDQARVVDLDEHTELKPMLKTNGFSIPGFRSGWFLLRNRRRGFVAIGGGARTLWLPTHGKHDLLLEPVDPAALLAHLRELAASRSAG